MPQTIIDPGDAAGDTAGGRSVTVRDDAGGTAGVSEGRGGTVGI